MCDAGGNLTSSGRRRLRTSSPGDVIGLGVILSEGWLVRDRMNNPQYDWFGPTFSVGSLPQSIYFKQILYFYTNIIFVTQIQSYFSLCAQIQISLKEILCGRLPTEKVGL